MTSINCADITEQKLTGDSFNITLEGEVDSFSIDDLDPSTTYTLSLDVTNDGDYGSVFPYSLETRELGMFVTESLLWLYDITSMTIYTESRVQAQNRCIGWQLWHCQYVGTCYSQLHWNGYVQWLHGSSQLCRGCQCLWTHGSYRHRRLFSLHSPRTDSPQFTLIPSVHTWRDVWIERLVFHLVLHCVLA